MINLFIVFNRKVLENYQKNKLCTISIIVLFCIGISLLIELLLFNYSCITSNCYEREYEDDVFVSEGFSYEGNGTFIGVENNGSITVDCDDLYVKQMSYRFMSQDVGSYSVMVDGKNFIDYSPSFSFYKNLPYKTINIHERTNKVVFQFNDIQGKEFVLEDITLKNQFQFNIIRYVCTIFFITASFLIYLYCIVLKKICFEKYAVVYIIIVGALLSFLIPANLTWDEQAHLVRSINTSQGNILYKFGEVVRYPKGYDLMSGQTTAYCSYDEYLEVNRAMNNYSVADDELVGRGSTATGYTFIPYIPSSIGVLLAHFLNLPIMFCLWFARLFNVLFYAVCIYWALKIFPFDKKIFFCCALIPTVLLLSASLCCDVVVLGMFSLVFSYLMKIGSGCIDNRIGIKQIGIIWICFFVIIMSKATYAPLMLLIGLIPSNKFKTSKSRNRIILFNIILCCVLFGISYIYMTILNATSDVDFNPWSLSNVDSTEQIKFILKNPLHYLSIIVNFFQENFVKLLEQMFLMQSSHIGKMNDFYELIICVLLLFMVITNKYEPLLCERKSRITILFSAILVCGLSLTALYATFTPVGKLTIDGFQGRYLLPILIPLLYAVSSKSIQIEINRLRTNQICIVAMFLISYGIVWQVVWKYLM